MRLADVNIFVYAYREDAPDHLKYKNWLEDMLNGPEAFGISELVLSGFLRIVTHPKIFTPASPVDHALRFTETIRTAPNAVLVAPGVRHWEIFSTLARNFSAKGNLIPDAYFAALAIESGSEWITTDRDFARFSNLRWRHPFD